MSQNDQNQQQLIDLIDAHVLDEFLTLYRKSLSVLKPFEHVEILLRACRFGSLTFVRNILNEDYVVDVNCRHPSTGYPPLFIAIRAQQHEIIEYLIRETQADVNLNCAIGEKSETVTTCLDEALRQQDISTVTLLLQHGAIADEHHLFLAIIECFRPEHKKTSPLILLDVLIAHHPHLLDKTGRTRAIEFVFRRACWLSVNSSDDIVSLFARVLLNDDPSPIGSVCYLKQTTAPHIHRTLVAIVGAGPAGLMLGALLSRSGIDSVILERYSQSHIESNIRAGVLEQSTIDLLDEVGASERLFRQGIIQRHVNLQFDGERISLPVVEMTEGKMLIIYGQHYVLQDLIKTRINSGQRLWFDIEDVSIERHDVTEDGHSPLLRFRRHGHMEDEELHCDFIIGCDGATSQCCRQSIPSGVLHTTNRIYPFAWLSILADVPPSGTELIYANHSQHGFAVHSLRSLTTSRFHLQVPLTDTLADWPDERIWSQLQQRLTPTNRNWTLAVGPILERAIFPLRSSVTSPMQYKRLFLVGDAVHIVPPTGAKGLNVAVKDAHLLAQAFVDYYDNDRWDKLNGYTAACSPHIWQAQEFANYMTLLLHNFSTSKDNNDTIVEFDQHLQRARQQNLLHSSALQHYIANTYAG